MFSKFVINLPYNFKLLVKRHEFSNYTITELWMLCWNNMNYCPIVTRLAVNVVVRFNNTEEAWLCSFYRVFVSLICVLSSLKGLGLWTMAPENKRRERKGHGNMVSKCYNFFNRLSSVGHLLLLILYFYQIVNGVLSHLRNVMRKRSVYIECTCNLTIGIRFFKLWNS